MWDFASLRPPRILTFGKRLLNAVAARSMFAAAFAIAAAPWCTAFGAEPPSRPNIVFIQTDDQGPWALGFSGHPQCRTPNLDRLAKEGAYLPNCFTTTPVCSPSRASLMTSRYGSEVGITDWINAAKEPGLGLDPKWVAWPELLVAGGYRTGLFGKWHLGDRPEQHPTRQGFQEFAGFLGGGCAPQNPILEIQGKTEKREGFAVDLVVDAALDFLKAKKPGPFLCSIHFREPHAPYRPTPEGDWAEFRELVPELFQPQHPDLKAAEARNKLKEYFSSVAALDRNVGRVLAALDEQGVAGNTLVVFISDHGYNIGQHGIWHKGNGHWMVQNPPPGTENIPKGQRPNLFDASIRVPCVVRWPGVVPAGSRVERTVRCLDWYPTLLSAAGAAIPADVKLRGNDALPLLKGKEIPWNDELYVEYSTHHQSKTHMRAWRTPQWKLVRDFRNPGRDELYHLAEDPAEEKNLIDAPGAPQAQRKLLEAKILAAMEETGDPVLKTLASPGGE